MTVDSRIRQALQPFGDDVYNTVSLSKNKRYYVFNVATIPADFGDDTPQHERNLVQVHLYAPLVEDITARKAATKRALYAAGFTWPAVTDASDKDGRHIVFECEDAEGVNADGDHDDDGAG